MQCPLSVRVFLRFAGNSDFQNYPSSPVLFLSVVSIAFIFVSFTAAVSSKSDIRCLTISSHSIIKLNISDISVTGLITFSSLASSILAILSVTL
ncbi:hypothetical protein XENOCAPTIV_012795 [Xenoophorus captivus]|uniref:Uncharacterized protein n=1 Tax=Xenoophorus captivus TaxID=1517983 RepID=A0ABV0S6M3_9TELE